MQRHPCGALHSVHWKSRFWPSIRLSFVHSLHRFLLKTWWAMLDSNEKLLCFIHDLLLSCILECFFILMCLLETPPPQATESPWPPKQYSFLVVGLLAFTLPSRLFVCFPVEFSYFQSARARATLSGLSNPIYDPITLKLATTGLSAPDPEYWGVVCLLGGTGN